MKVLGVLLAIALFSCAAAAGPQAQPSPAVSAVPLGPAPSPTADAGARFAKGDAAFRARKADARAREALDEYRKLYDDDTGDVDAAWRFAMACYFVGLRVTHDSSEKTKLFGEGRDAAQFAAIREPSCAPCHFWAATNMILYGQEVGTVKMLFSLKEIQAHLHKTLELDPTYMSSGGYRILGILDQKLPGVIGGDDVRAREELEKAVTSSPKEPLNYLFLARFYWSVLHDHDKAVATAQKGIAIQGIPVEMLESQEAQDDLRKLLVEIH